MNVPQVVTELASKNGFNSVSLSKHSGDKYIYSVECKDKNGFAMPVGLPSFIIYDGKSCQLVSGDEGLILSASLFGEE